MAARTENGKLDEADVGPLQRRKSTQSGAGRARPAFQERMDDPSGRARSVRPHVRRGSGSRACHQYEAAEEPVTPSGTMEDLIVAAVERAVHQALDPHLHRLNACEPIVFTVAQAAQVLLVSEDTVPRMVRRGTLPRVPHVGTKVLIPRRALFELVEAAEGTPETDPD